MHLHSVLEYFFTFFIVWVTY